MPVTFEAYLDLGAAVASQRPSPISDMFVHDYHDGIESGVVVMRSGECFRIRSPDESRFVIFRAYVFSRISSVWISDLMTSKCETPHFSWIDDAMFAAILDEHSDEHYCCIGNTHLSWFVATRLTTIPPDLTFRAAHRLLRHKFRPTMPPSRQDDRNGISIE